MKRVALRPCLRPLGALLLSSGLALGSASAAELVPEQIGEAANAEATLQPGGVVRIGWSRDGVPVTVEGVRLPPAQGLGSWAAFKAMGDRGQAMVMGDTVVFQDEVDAAMDAAFASGLEVTGLHNHFFYDEPRVYFMHIGGEGPPMELAAGVRSIWEAIKAVRVERRIPAAGFGGPDPVVGELDAEAIAEIIGHPTKVNGDVVKITIGREGLMHGRPVGASMGLTTWAAFNGSDAAASIDGDFIMTAEEVQPVLRALRAGGLHVVALHNHMMGESPVYYFTHFWGTGRTEELARAFRAALDAQEASAEDAVDAQDGA